MATALCGAGGRRREQARAEGLDAWEIWRGDWRVERHDPAVPDPPLISPSRDLLDRLGEALRRYRHGRPRLPWSEWPEAEKEGWRDLAAAFVMDLKTVGIRIEVEP